MLVAIRDEKQVIDSDRFAELLSTTTKFEKPMDAHAADWAFSFVSRKLFAVLDATSMERLRKSSKKLRTRTALRCTAS